MPLVVYGGTAAGSPWGAWRVISPSLVDGDLIFEDEAHTILAQCLTTATGEIVIPSTVTTIREEAFRDCTGLTAITIPSSVTTIESSAFSNCTGVISITIPESVTTIGTNAFSNVYNIQYDGTATGSPWGAQTVGGYIEGYVVYDSEQKTAVVRCHTLATGSIVLPQSVIAIEGEAFKDCKDITSINLPESVITIGAKAFSGCEGITSITIPENVTTIGGDAFRGCKNMTSVVWNAKNCEGYYSVSSWLGNYLGTIGTFGQGLNGNEYITSFTFGPEVEKIPKYICYYMPNLTEIIIPESVKTIEACAFMYCTSLTSITIPTSVTRIEGDGRYLSSSFGYGAFVYSGLTSITIPDNVTHLGVGTFSGCKNLQTATIGSGIEELSSGVFEDCYALDSVSLSDSLKSIGEYAFTRCTSLTSIIIPKNVTTIKDRAFRDCTALTSVTLSENLISIESDAFSGCKELTDITFPEHLTTMGDYAFYGCDKLTDITLPQSMTDLGSRVFLGCTGISSITVEAIEPPATVMNGYYSTFDSLPADLPVNVPCGGYELYLSSNWGYYFTNLQSPVPPYTLRAWSQSDAEGSVSIDKTQQCAGIGYLTATPEFGYRFVQWNDGNTDNPRTFELTQDTNFVAEFALATSGKCGDDLYWVYEDGKIRISGTGAMYDYTATTQPWLLLRDNLTEVTICNTATYIGTYAFAQAYSLASVSIGSSVWRIGANAFAGCTRLYHVYSYASYPPSAESSSFANYNVYVHVPCESVEDYELNALWGDFKYIKCMESDEVVVPSDEVSVSPAYEDEAV
ncbi:MAG: leucine-rich repeat protein [Paludibacteraceae bacterium]